MGKKAVAIIGSENEQELKKKQSEKLRQKKLRERGKTAKVAGMGGGQRVVDTTEESLRELEVIEKKQQVFPTPKDSKKIKKSKAHSKPYQAAKSRVTIDHLYPISDAIKLLREVSLTKFDGTVELHIVLKEKSFSKEVELPHSTGKIRRVAVADDVTVAKIESGKIDFDVLYSSPNQMGKLVKFAKVLGPRGLMPNPKTGTISTDPEKRVKELAGGELAWKTEPDHPVIHQVIGKVSFTEGQISENLAAFVKAISAGKIAKLTLNATMGPGIKVDLGTL